jgi:hypothetical protein
LKFTLNKARGVAPPLNVFALFVGEHVGGPLHVDLVVLEQRAGRLVQAGDGVVVVDDRLDFAGFGVGEALLGRELEIQQELGREGFAALLTLEQGAEVFGGGAAG